MWRSVLCTLALVGCSYVEATNKNAALEAARLYTGNANSLSCYLRDKPDARGGALEAADDKAYYMLQVARSEGYQAELVRRAEIAVHDMDRLMVDKGVKDYAASTDCAH